MSDLSATSAESRGTAHFRMVSVVQQLGFHLDPGHDFQFNFTRPRPVVVHFTRDDHDPDAAVCAATCVAEIEDTIPTKLASPLKDDIAALGSLSSSELSALDNILMDLRTLLRSTNSALSMAERTGRRPHHCRGECAGVLLRRWQ